MVIRPRLEQREFDRGPRSAAEPAVQLRDMPPALAERAFMPLLYRTHPYGHLPIGTEESLRAMTVEEVRGFHAWAYHPSARDGHCGRRRAARSRSRRSSSRRSALDAFRHDRCGHGREHRGAASAAADRLQLIHRAGAAQSELRIGHVSVPRSSPGLPRAARPQHVLGGQFVSRINMNLREDKGYTYGARTAFDFRRGPGPFVLQASVQSDATADAVREALDELRAIRGDRPVTRQELELGRAGLTRGYPRNFETGGSDRPAPRRSSRFTICPTTTSRRSCRRVLSLTESDITRRGCDAHIDPSRLAAVIVGDRDKVGASLDRPGSVLGPRRWSRADGQELPATADRRSPLSPTRRPRRSASTRTRPIRPHRRAGRSSASARCALNHLDLWQRRGLDRVRIPLPHISGSDVAGRSRRRRRRDVPAGTRASCCSRG